MKVSGIARPVLVAMIAVAVAALAASAFAAVSVLTRHTTTHTRVLPATPTLDVRAGAGDVEVFAADRPDIRLITKERRSAWGHPHVRVRVVAPGRLVFDDGCKGWDLDGCHVRYRLDVPPGTDVRVTTRAGDVHVTDVAGTLALHTTAGDIHADAPAPTIDASTRGGDIDITARAPRRVRAQATAGDVSIAVPDATYAVRVATRAGDEHVGVRTDPRAPRSIEATTHAGDIHVSRSG